MKELTRAIQKRGFIVKQNGNCLEISKGNHPLDYRHLQRLLKSTGISFESKNGLLIINKNNYNDDQLLLIEQARTHNHETSTPDYVCSWKYFIKRKHGKKIIAITIDYGVAALVKALSAIGIITTFSCDGHERKAPFIEFAGPHNMFWFELLQEKYLSDLCLEYQWNVKAEVKSTFNKYLLKAKTNNLWDLRFVQNDSWKMAKILLAHQEEIRNLKAEIFREKGEIKPTNRLVKTFDDNDLKEWIISKWDFKVKENLS